VPAVSAVSMNSFELDAVPRKQLTHEQGENSGISREVFLILESFPKSNLARNALLHVCVCVDYIKCFVWGLRSFNINASNICFSLNIEFYARYRRRFRAVNCLIQLDSVHIEKYFSIKDRLQEEKTRPEKKIIQLQGQRFIPLLQPFKPKLI
jgi:hypothetical protein